MDRSSSAPQGGTPADLVELGRIVSAYGVRGWIKIQPHSAHSQTLLSTSTWWIRAPDSQPDPGAFLSFRPVQVVASREHSATVVAQLASIPDRDHAEGLKGHTIWVQRSAFPPTDDDEYYWVDLIGCRLFGDDNGHAALIGQVQGVIDNGAHAVLRVARATLDAGGDLVLSQDDSGRSIEVLVPFVRAHVHTVDVQNKILHSNWPVAF